MTRRIIGAVLAALMLAPVPALAQVGREPGAGGTAAEAGGKPALDAVTNFNECRKIPKNRKFTITLKKGADLGDLVAWISTVTCKRFIVADSMRAQKVTIVAPTPVSVNEAYRAFLSSLEVMGLTVVPAGRYLKVVQSNWAIQAPIPTYGDKDRRRVPANETVVTQMITVQNVDVNELLLVLNKLKSRSGDVTAYKPSNTLIVTDTAVNIRRMLGIITELDVAVAGEKIWVVRLKYADPSEVYKVISQIFTSTTGAPGRPAARRAPGRGAVKPGGDDVSNAKASKIIADQSTNSLIIVAAPDAFNKIAALVRKMDVEGEGIDQKIHVYYLENGDAEEMSSTLGSLTSGGARQPRGRRRPQRGVAQAASLFEGDVKITADKSTNSLVIVATNKDYMSLRRVIKKLDIPRRQVFVEASILEISMDKARKMGFAYHGGGITGEGDDQSIIFGGVQHKDWSSLVINPLNLMGLAVGARGATIDGSDTLLGLGQDIPAFGVMFQAIQNNSNVNILSSPHILTTDNEEAEITVGQNLPFQGSLMGGGLAGAAASSTNNNFAGMFPSVSVQRQDVALKMKLTPHVNESDMVRLELEQEVSDVVSKDYNGLGPATSKRSAKTTVVVSDQQTVVIGGLMSNRITESVSKVPLLGDIPILGYLFKYKNKSLQKTNLLIVLTPYVIRDQSDLRRILKKKIEERREFIERYTSFDHREITSDVDFRHKRGLLAEINHVARQAETEAKLLRDAQVETAHTVVEPVDMPKGVAPSADNKPAGPPGYNPIEPRLAPAAERNARAREVRVQPRPTVEPR